MRRSRLLAGDEVRPGALLTTPTDPYAPTQVTVRVLRATAPYLSCATTVRSPRLTGRLRKTEDRGVGKPHSITCKSRPLGCGDKAFPAALHLPATLQFTGPDADAQYSGATVGALVTRCVYIAQRCRVIVGGRRSLGGFAHGGAK